MRVLVLSDIHANLDALQAVLSAAGDVDQTWCLGDIIGYGPDPNECIETLRARPNLTCLLGNHDAAALNHIAIEAFNREARLSIQWLQEILTSEHKNFLANLPDRIIIDQVTLAHGSPRNPVWEYLLDSGSAAENFFFFDTQICLVGHTHLPLAYIAHDQTGSIERRILQDGDKFILTGRAILNPGSTGQPRDHDPRAAYAIFDTETLLWCAYRVAYDFAPVQERIRLAGLPVRHALRLAEGW